MYPNYKRVRYRGSCTHTNNRGNEWWQVDLGRVYQVDHVRVWGRTDAHVERLEGARVGIECVDSGHGHLFPISTAHSKFIIYKNLYI